MRTIAIDKYAPQTIISVMKIDNGISLCGNFASSPAAATLSKPTKPKKHLAAPAIIPLTPKGTNPPLPACPLCSTGISSKGMFQLYTSAINKVIYYC